jgi:hypothetical protein
MPNNMMAWAYRKNARHRNPRKDAMREAVCYKTRGRPRRRWLDCVQGPEKDGYQQVEGQSTEPRSLEAYCGGGQGPPRAVELFRRNKERLCSWTSWTQDGVLLVRRQWGPGCYLYSNDVSGCWQMPRHTNVWHPYTKRSKTWGGS